MKRVLFTSIVVMACVAFMQWGAYGAEFCVSNATELQDALAQAGTNGEDDVIKVVQGTYIGNFSYSSSQGNSITLLGGCTSGCTGRDLDPSNTVLDGGGSGRVLYLHNSNGGDMFLEGFTLQNGDTSGEGGGIWAFASSESGTAGNITLTNNIIIGNTSEEHGGGVYSRSSSVVGMSGDVILINNIITGNRASLHGGGVNSFSGSYYGTSGDVILTNNTITGNTSAGNVANPGGGGVLAWSSSSSGTAANIILTNNIVRGNSADEGGGVLAYSFSATSGTPGSVILTNNTVTGNTANEGGGVRLEMINMNNVIDVYNNIIWGNTASLGADIYLEEGFGTATGYNNDYSDMSGSWDNSGGNIDENPLFIDADHGNYHLRSISPCIDAGTNAALELPSADLEGDPRIVDGDDDGTETVDMGADEYVYVPYNDVTVIVPNGGETLSSGSMYPIQWGAPPVAVSFTLKYSINSGREWKLIAQDLTGDYYDWYVPTPSKNKKKCLVKVIGYEDSGAKIGVDKSDAMLTIEVVRVTTPNGGEALSSGSMYTITWITNETKKPVEKVNLFYSKNAGRTWKRMPTLPGNPGRYEWTVAYVPKTKTRCRVKVVLKDAKGNTVGNDKSDGDFTIWEFD
jgi:hypothetical protein